MYSKASTARGASFLVTARLTVEGAVFTLIICFVQEGTWLACCARLTFMAFGAEGTALSTCFRLRVKESALLACDALAVNIEFETFIARVANFTIVTLITIDEAFLASICFQVVRTVALDTKAFADRKVV